MNEFKYAQLREYLISKINDGNLASGSAIEPELKLAERFNLSRNTVRQALKCLETEGWIARKRGAGSFVRDNNPAALRKVAAILYETAFAPDSIVGKLLASAGRVLEKSGYELDLFAGKRRENSFDLRFLDNGYCGALITSRRLPTELLAEFGKRGLPYIYIKNAPTDAEKPHLHADYYQGGFLAGKHLAECGRKELALYYFGDDYCPDAVYFRQGVTAAALEFGLKFPQKNIITIPDGNFQLAESLTAAIIEQPRDKLGIITMEDYLAAFILRALRRRAIDVPKEIAVLGCNNSLLCGLLTPELSSIEIHPEKIGTNAATALIENLQNGKELPQIAIIPEIIVRKTT